MSKDSNVGYNFKGDINTLLTATKKAIDKMSLNVKSENHTHKGFQLIAAEKMKWLTTNWPVNFTIEATSNDNYITLLITSTSKLTSITQDNNNYQKANELLNLIKIFAPNREA